MSDYKATFQRWRDRYGPQGTVLRRLVQGTAMTLYNEMSSGGRYSPGTPVGNPSLWKNPAPKGYVGGFHRASWDAAIGSLPQGAVVDKGNPTPGIAAADAQVTGVVASLEPGQTLYATNNGPGIRRLEFTGWSSQAPDGFVRPAAEAIQPIADEVTTHLRNEAA